MRLKYVNNDHNQTVHFPGRHSGLGREWWGMSSWLFFFDLMDYGRKGGSEWVINEASNLSVSFPSIVSSRQEIWLLLLLQLKLSKTMWVLLIYRFEFILIPFSVALCPILSLWTSLALSSSVVLPFLLNMTPCCSLPLSSQRGSVSDPAWPLFLSLLPRLSLTSPSQRGSCPSPSQPGSLTVPACFPLPWCWGLRWVVFPAASTVTWTAGVRLTRREMVLATSS